MRPVRWAQHVAASDLGKWAKTVAMCLATHCTGGDQPMSTCSVAALARWSGFSEDSMKRGLRELQEATLIVGQHRHRKTCRATHCDGCAPTRWILLPVSARELGGDAPAPETGRTSTPLGGRTSTPLKEKDELEGTVPLPAPRTANVIDFSQIGRRP